MTPQDRAVNANTAEATGIPLRSLVCQQLGRHQLHTPGRLWCDCPNLEPDSDDRGELLMRQSSRYSERIKRVAG